MPSISEFFKFPAVARSPEDVFVASVDGLYPISSAWVLSPNASTGVPILSSIDT